MTKLNQTSNVTVVEEAQLGQVVGGNRGCHRRYNYCYDRRRDYCDYNDSDYSNYCDYDRDSDDNDYCYDRKRDRDYCHYS